MSTPIETNTEELQEVLQQVYNLPSRSSGGSATPDLVIVVDGSGNNYLDDMTASAVSIESGSLDDTIEKIGNGQYASVLLKLKTLYETITYCQIFYPESVGVINWGASDPMLAVKFDARYYPGSLDYTYAFLLKFAKSGTVYLSKNRFTWAAST